MSQTRASSVIHIAVLEFSSPSGVLAPAFGRVATRLQLYKTNARMAEYYTQQEAGRRTCGGIRCLRCCAGPRQRHA